MFDPRQLIWLSFALLVPMIIILMRKDSWLIFWICLTTSINLFDTNIGVNLAATRITGLLLLPFAIGSIPILLKTFSGKMLLWILFYSVSLAIVFGYIFPWGDTGYTRTVTQSASGRAFIYTGRNILDLSVAIFIARWLKDTLRFDSIIYYLIAGTTVSALSIVFQQVTRLDIYYLLTGLGIDLSMIDRARGLNFEPRGAGLIMTHGILLSIAIQFQHKSRSSYWLISLYFISFLFAASASATVALAISLVVLISFNFSDKKIGPIFNLTFLGGIVFLFFSTILIDTPFFNNLDSKLSTSNNSDLIPTNWIESIAYKMDIFDSASFIFLASNPFYILMGTGPGLISLPASDFIPNSANAQWATVDGINSLPSMGWLLEMSNVGLVGLMSLLIFGFRTLKIFSDMEKLYPLKQDVLRLGRNAFLVGFVIYLVQASAISSLLSVFLGMGLGAAELSRQKESQLKNQMM